MKKFAFLMLLLCAGMNIVFAQIAVPTLNSPADGYVYPNTVKPFLKMNTVSGASYYLFHWSEDPTFATYSSHTMQSSYTGLNVNGLKYGTTYYWRVYAITANYADTSASSAVWSFTTTDAPTITAPADGTVLTNSIMPNIQWTEIVGATNYIYQCDTTPSFNSSLRRTYTLGYQSGGSNPLNLSFGKTYYLRMRATNTSESDTSAWSAVRSFTTSDSITLVSFNDPSPTANYYTRQTLSWKPYRGVTQYFLQLDTTPHFNSPVLQQINYTSSSTSTTDNQSVIINNMRYGSMYYWRVRAANYNGSDTSSWSATWQFHTMDFVNNTDNTINNSDSTQNYYTRQTLYWKNNRGSTKYLLQLDTTPHFNSPILREIYTTNAIDNTTNELSTKVYNMLYGTMYYYRVCAINNAPDTSGWSATWQFHTINKVFSTSNTLNDTTQTETYFTRISMKWENNRGSTQYILQLDTTPDFNSPVFRQVNITNDIDDETNELSTTVYNLLHGAMYYYRICAINNAPDTSDWSNTWQFHTRDKVFLYSPENQTTNASLSTTLQWKNNKGSSKFILQVDTSTNFNSSSLREIIVASSITNNDSYKSYTLNDLRFGNTYYWRVRSVNEAPDTSGWSDVWSFTTANGVPTLVSPADGYVYPSTVKPLLRLEAVTGASYYLFHWSEDPTFATYSSYTMSSSYTGLNVNGLKFGTTYYWRVFSITANYADTSASSAVWSFTTTDAPTITAPNDGTILTNSISPNIQWTEMVGATKYIYQCDTSASFNSPVKRTYTVSYSSGGSSPLNLRFGATYYLRMRATNTDESDTSAWSAVRTFITSDAPVLNSPSNGYVYSSSVNPTLKCETIRNIGKYIYQWDTTSNFNSPLCRSTVQTSTSVTVGPLKLGTTYYWRMCATNYNDSDTSSWSAVWSFTTGGSIPTLASPSNGSTAVRLRPTLDWNAVSSCDYYDYECDTTPQFNSPELQSGAIAAGTSEVRLNQLRYGTTYYWHVRIRLNSDTSSWSTVWSFTTAGTIALTSPSNGTTLYRYLHPTLDWDFINDGDYYEYQYDLSPDFNSPELVSGLVAVGTSEVDLTAPMRFDTTYYWRVREYTSIDTTPWSATWSFTTPGEIALVSPANGSTLSRTLNPTLDWDYINGGDMYEYQYDLSPDFDSPELVTGQRAVGTSEIDITTPLRFGATYYWRVRETTSIDTTPWSATWSFTTPGEIALVSPANGTTNVGASTTLDWDYIRGGTIYEYQYDVTPAFNSAELVEGSIQVGTSQVTISDLEENRLYYWRVRELSAVDTTPWSEVWHFSTRMQPIFTDVYDTACDSYTWNGQTYTQSGEYTRQFVTALQADSTVTLHLTIYHSVTSTSSVTVCESDLPYHYVNGDIDTTFEVGTPQLSTFNFQLLTQHGCDSTVILTLNVRSANYTELTETACGNYTWNDEVYEESGDYVQTFTNAAGCDSVVTLHLTIFTANYADFADNACGSYTWNGEVYEESGDYVQTFTNVNGCDSVVTLHLTIFTANYADFADNACGSYTWNNEVYEESGDYVQTFTNANGCDSVVTLHLTIYEPVTELVEVTICESDLPYHYVNGDIDTTFEIGTPQLSTFNFQLLTQHGCDSTVTLTLTIEPCDTNGINENGMANLTLYPNPTTGMVNVQFTMNNVQFGESEIQVLDVYGRLLQNVETCHGASLQTTQIDLSQYTPGVYLIRLVGDGRVIGVRKVVRR
ncbi:MAG: T9SS type A sorting domain-containing protein [Bacteroidales bacterium]|nr:T9SS type A sorting domain-containing protein [Bacteroidales bacterium]